MKNENSRKAVLWASLVLANCTIHTTALASKHDWGTIEEQVTRMLMDKQDYIDALRGLKSHYLRYAGKIGVTRKDRACFRDLARVIDRQIYEFRLATDDVTYQQFLAQVEEDPDEAHEWAEEIVELRESMGAAIQSTHGRSQDECMSFED